MSKTDMLTLLEREHRELEGQLKMIISTGEACQCVDLPAMRKLVRNLDLHVQIEEMLLYPKAKDEHEVSNLVQDFYAEHREIKTLLEPLRSDRPVFADVGVVLDSCKKILNTLQCHVHQEEGQLFPVLRSQWDEIVLLELGDKMLELKDRELTGR